MPRSPAAAFPAIDPNNPFTRDLLRSLAGTVRAQPYETAAEYDERLAAATTTWASFRPRDPMEQMLAAQIVSAHYASLDYLNQAMETDDPAHAERLRRSHATLTRTMRDAMRQLDRQQQRPADTAPPLAIKPIPQPRRRPPEPKTTQQPMHRDALELLPQILPGVVVPESYYQNALPLVA